MLFLVKGQIASPQYYADIISMVMLLLNFQVLL